MFHHLLKRMSYMANINFMKILAILKTIHRLSIIDALIREKMREIKKTQFCNALLKRKQEKKLFK